MLTISQQTMQKQQEHREKDHSVPALCLHLRTRFKHTIISDLSDKELSEQVQTAVDIGHVCGLTSKGDFYDFVLIELTRARGFYKHPKIQALLNDPDAPPTFKMRWLALHLHPTVWKEVYTCKAHLV